MKADVRIFLMRTVPTFNNASQTSSMEMVLMDEFTTLIRCASELIPVYGLSLVPFKDDFKKDDDYDFLIDVIRLLTGVSAGSRFEREGKMIKMVVIKLTYHRGKIDCALFGDYVSS